MSLVYGSTTTLAITAASLAAATARSAAAVTSDTSVSLVDYQINVSVLTTATAPTGNKQVIVYAYASSDGTTYDGASAIVDNVDGTDKALTAIGIPSNLRLLGTLQLNQGANIATIDRNFSLQQALGFMPPKWGIVLYNDSGVALGSSVTVTARSVSYN